MISKNIGQVCPLTLFYKTIENHILVYFLSILYHIVLVFGHTTFLFWFTALIVVGNNSRFEQGT